MGSIQNKRGSVRGAPPEVYLPFIADDDEECGKEFEAIGIETTVFFLGGLILWAGVTLWRAFRNYFL